MPDSVPKKQVFLILIQSLLGKGKKSGKDKMRKERIIRERREGRRKIKEDAEEVEIVEERVVPVVAVAAAVLVPRKEVSL